MSVTELYCSLLDYTWLVVTVVVVVFIITIIFCFGSGYWMGNAINNNPCYVYNNVGEYERERERKMLYIKTDEEFELICCI